jgi:hypothetical protein
MAWALVLAAAAVAACGGTSLPRSTPEVPPKRAPVKGGPIARVMVPAELGDAGALERIPWRTRRAAPGTIWLSIGGKPITPYETFYDYDEWPVIAEAGKLVQIVKDAGSARVAVWIGRDALVTVAREDVAVGEMPGAVPDPVHNATLLAGAKVVRGKAFGGETQLYLDDPDLAITGWVPDGAVGEIYRHAEDLEYQDSFSIRADSAIRAAPSADAAVLATTVRAVAAIGHPGAPVGWKEITAHTDNAVVRGFVKASAIDPGLVIGHGEGHGSGYGSSHSIRMTVPAGTCVFAEPEGEVIGVQLDAHDYPIDRNDGPTWWQITLMNDLAPLDVYVRDTTSNGNPSKVELESCAN